jgi:phenylacetate-CoA ligase
MDNESAPSGIAPNTAEQHARLVDLVNFARTRSPFYARRYAQVAANIAGPRDLPPVTKPELMAHFDDWVTDPEVTRAGVDAFLADEALITQSYLDRYAVWVTSGTSGETGIYVHDSNARAIYTSLWLTRGIMPWMRQGRMEAIQRQGAREATIVATGGHFSTFSLAESRRRLHPDRSRIFSVSTPLPELVEKLNHFQPATLGTYPNVLQLLAQEQVAGRLNISPVLLASGGETLTPAVRGQITTAFNCPLWESYGACEFPPIAYSCAHGWLHVNADWVILEPVDRTYQPVPPGQPSHTALLTNLVNRAQPIIRCELGDRITVRPDPCPCGSSLPAIQVEGRHDEILSFPAPSGELIRVLPMALAAVIKLVPEVRRFQLTQTAPTALQVRLAMEPGTDDQQVSESVVHRLQDYLSAQGLPSIHIQRAPEPPLPDPVSGKFRRIWADESVAQTLEALPNQREKETG